jgi:hypothetical protein
MSLISAIFGADFGTPEERPVADLCSDCGPHDDEILDKTILPSPYEQMDEGTRRDLLPFSDDYDDEKFRKLLVIVLKCKKCGRVRKITESNP